MVASKVKYEVLREQRMEENKKKLEQLHLPLLSQALQKAASPKTSPVVYTFSSSFILCFLFLIAHTHTRSGESSFIFTSQELTCLVFTFLVQNQR